MSLDLAVKIFLCFMCALRFIQSRVSYTACKSHTANCFIVNKSYLRCLKCGFLWPVNALDTAGLQGALPSPPDPSSTLICTRSPQASTTVSVYLAGIKMNKTTRRSQRLGKPGSDLCDTSDSYLLLLSSSMTLLPSLPHHRSSQLLSLRPGFKCLVYLFVLFGSVEMSSKQHRNSLCP